MKKILAISALVLFSLPVFAEDAVTATAVETTAAPVVAEAEPAAVVAEPAVVVAEPVAVVAEPETIETVAAEVDAYGTELGAKWDDILARLDVEDARPKLSGPYLRGYAKTLYGHDLDTDRNGFELDILARIIIPLTPPRDTTKTELNDGKGAVKGSSVFEGAKFGFYITNKYVVYGGPEVLNTYDPELSLAEYYSRPEITARIDLANGGYMIVGGNEIIAPDAVISDDVNFDISALFGEFEDQDHNGIGDKNEGFTIGFNDGILAAEFTMLNEDGGYINTDGSNSIDEAYFVNDLSNKLVTEAEDEVMMHTSADNDGYYLGGKLSYSLGYSLTAALEYGTDVLAIQETDELFPLVGSLLEVAIPLQEKRYTAESGTKHAFALDLMSSPIEMLKITLPADVILKNYTGHKMIQTDVVKNDDGDPLDEDGEKISITGGDEVPVYSQTGNEINVSMTGVEVKPEVAIDIDALTFKVHGHGIYINEVLSGSVSDDANVTYLSYAVGGSIAYKIKNVITPELTLLSNLGSAKYDVTYDGADLTSMPLGWGLNAVLDLKGAKYYSVSIGCDNVIEDSFDHIDLEANIHGEKAFLDGLSISIKSDLLQENNMFQLEEFKIEATSALTNVENTTFTVSWTDFDTNSDRSLAKKGTFFFGAEIAVKQ